MSSPSFMIVTLLQRRLMQQHHHAVPPNAHAHTYRHAHKNTRTQKHAHTNTRTNTQTHTHTHTRGSSSSGGGGAHGSESRSFVSCPGSRRSYPYATRAVDGPRAAHRRTHAAQTNACEKTSNKPELQRMTAPPSSRAPLHCRAPGKTRTPCTSSPRAASSR